MKEIAGDENGPWLIIGDLNNIRGQEEKVGELRSIFGDVKHLLIALMIVG